MTVTLYRAALPLACGLLAAIYLPDAGLGFIKDDFVWIATSRLEALASPFDLLEARTGFFRPVVAATFSVNEMLFGLHPRGYGLTNLLLLMLCVGAAALLFARHLTHAGVAMATALVWGFNLHGVNMAVLWVSGRTALCLCLWMALAAWGFATGARVWPVAAAALAMMSKEEGFVLPAILAAWTIVAPLPASAATRLSPSDASGGAEPAGDRHSIGTRLAQAARLTWPYWLTAAVLLVVRSGSGAMTPWNAPGYYQYSFSVATLARNVLEYTDRAFTTSVAVTIVVWLVLGRPSLRGTDRRLVWRGLIWAGLSLLPTLLLPSRSSLYALLPAIGGALALAAVVDGWIRQVPPARIRVAVTTLLVIGLAMWPIYRSRNARLANEARLSSELLRHVEALRREGGRGLVIVHDTGVGRPTADQALGGQASLAADLVTGGRIVLRIESPHESREPGPVTSGAGGAGPAPAPAPPDDASPELPIVAELSVRDGVAQRIR